jgi:hypothetical protein
MYHYLARLGYTDKAIELKYFLFADAERRWEIDKKAIEKNPNYHVPV